MSEKSDVKVPEEIRKGWEEARLCANLIREGKAKIMIATRKDGTTYFTQVPSFCIFFTLSYRFGATTTWRYGSLPSL